MGRWQRARGGAHRCGATPRTLAKQAEIFCLQGVGVYRISRSLFHCISSPSIYILRSLNALVWLTAGSCNSSPKQAEAKEVGGEQATACRRHGPIRPVIGTSSKGDQSGSQGRCLSSRQSQSSHRAVSRLRENTASASSAVDPGVSRATAAVTNHGNAPAATPSVRQTWRPRRVCLARRPPLGVCSASRHCADAVTRAAANGLMAGRAGFGRTTAG